MKRFISKIKKLKNNVGSGVILIIVALGFIGILTGALLTAVGYAYRQKLYDYNARDNFYYVEQAMDEIYAGVGNNTIECLQKAYQETVENIARYDFDEKSYVAIDENDANKMFKTKFMENIKKSYYDIVISDMDSFIDTLSSYISNETVKLDSSGIAVIMYKSDNTVFTGSNFEDLDRIVIRNVTLKRSVDYNRSTANGKFEQTLSTDIVIGKPDFNVSFSNISTNYSTIFDYAVIADMGLEITQASSVPLTINGNVYAASDFYNKAYNFASDTINTRYSVTSSNQPGYSSTVTNPAKNNTAEQYTKSVYLNTRESGGVTYKDTTLNYQLNSVTSKVCNFETYSSENVYSSNTTLFNSVEQAASGIRQLSNYDGVNLKSKYSGLYIGGSDVTVISDMLIVPGTIAVMDDASLQTFGASGNKIKTAEVWTDNFVLGGTRTTKTNGSNATINGNIYVKDDLELNSTDSSFKLKGSYYGYGDSARRDNRVFTPMVDPLSYKEDNQVDNRGHYNSSAIVINGQNSTLDLTSADSLFLAGRAYIELSKTTTDVVPDSGASYTTYTYDSSVSDYRTGDSVATKANQIAYKSTGNNFEGVEVTQTDGTKVINPIEETVTVEGWDMNLSYYRAYLNENQKQSELFQKYFGDSSGKVEWVPVIKATADGKTYYYYDFNKAYANAVVSQNAIYEELNTNSGRYDFNPEIMAEHFIIDYNATAQDEDDDTAITGLDDEENGFKAGDIKLPGTNVYSSGALTTKDGTTFNIATSNSTASYNLNQALNRTDNFNVNTAINVYALSWQLAEKYNYVKFALTDDATDANAAMDLVVKSIVSKPITLDKTDLIGNLIGSGTDDYSNTSVLHGEAAITPINTYMNFDKIGSSFSPIRPKLTGVTLSGGGRTLDLNSDNSVWVSYGDLTVYTKDGNPGKVNGIIISKGDVIFDANVTEFNGLIVSGGKVYVTNSNRITKINANSEVCKSVFRALQVSGTDEAKDVLSLFKQYEEAETIEDISTITDYYTIDKVDYSNVMRYDNWTKSVE